MRLYEQIRFSFRQIAYGRALSAFTADTYNAKAVVFYLLFTQNVLLFSRCFFNIIFKNVGVFDLSLAVIRYAPVSLRRLCYKLFLLHPAPSGYPIFQLPLLQFRVDRFTLSESGTHALYGKRTVCKEQPREMLV